MARRSDTIAPMELEIGSHMPRRGAGASKVVGRFAPTPSGRMHLGNVFSLLMAWESARSQGGRVILRIEDLDPRARRRRCAQDLMRDLEWLGLSWDEGPYFQSERTEVYLEALERLEGRGLTYPCFCTRSELHAASAPHASDGTYVYRGTCRSLSPSDVARLRKLRPAAMRLRVPDAEDPAGTIGFSDRTYGSRHEVLAHNCGDFLVQRSDGVVAYQLAVVVDDALMGVSEVVRGRDLLGSVARQSYLAHLLGLPTPVWAHVPLLVTPEGRRLSKRDHDLDLGVLRERGVGSAQIIGWLAHAVGLAERDEALSTEELLERFSWDALVSHRDNVVVDDCPSFRTCPCGPS